MNLNKYVEIRLVFHTKTNCIGTHDFRNLTSGINRCSTFGHFYLFSIQNPHNVWALYVPKNIPRLGTKMYLCLRSI